ncbi:hypothetical protein BDR26DRAFT_950430 [Obelidium mucronatum]|nr:hypothetical protein BDR26DRAFT_950430 [Obelidium mucronatum]
MTLTRLINTRRLGVRMNHCADLKPFLDASDRVAMPFTTCSISKPSLDVEQQVKDTGHFKQRSFLEIPRVLFKKCVTTAGISNIGLRAFGIWNALPKIEQKVAQVAKVAKSVRFMFPARGDTEYVMHSADDYDRSFTQPTDGHLRVFLSLVDLRQMGAITPNSARHAKLFEYERFCFGKCPLSVDQWASVTLSTNQMRYNRDDMKDGPENTFMLHEPEQEWDTEDFDYEKFGEENGDDEERFGTYIEATILAGETQRDSEESDHMQAEEQELVRTDSGLSLEESLEDVPTSQGSISSENVDYQPRRHRRGSADF